LIVTKSSALINSSDSAALWETPIPVDATHRGMCRFSSSKDPTYMTVVHSIERIRQGNVQKAVVKNEFYHVPKMLNPWFTGRNDIRSLVKEALIAERYTTDNQQKRYVLFGMGGSGKTQITLKFAHDHRKRYFHLCRAGYLTDYPLVSGRFSSSTLRASQWLLRDFRQLHEQ
jgi:hypothetical protein